MAKNQILVRDLDDNKSSNWRYRIVKSNQRVTMKTGTPPQNLTVQRFHAATASYPGSSSTALPAP